MENEQIKTYGLELEVFKKDGSVICITEIFLTIPDLIETILAYCSDSDVCNHTYCIYYCYLTTSYQ